jgi:hypothetical protein
MSDSSTGNQRMPDIIQAHLDLISGLFRRPERLRGVLDNSSIRDEDHPDRSTRSDDHRDDRYVPAVSESEGRSKYAIELTACFQFSINTTIEGPRGLTKEELEDRIEADWQSISVETDVLLESHWELEGFEQRPATGAER